MESEMDGAEQLVRKVVDTCTDCDICRYLMDTNCLFFPTMYNLWDRETENGEPITRKELRALADLCNYCALCPCPNIREDIIAAKTRFVDRDGLDTFVRTLEDVERVGRLCGAVPRLSNLLLQGRLTGRLIKKIAGINVNRKLPVIPDENFPAWAKQHALIRKNSEPQKHKVAYFAGCTARYVFPEVAKAAIRVLQQNGIPIYYPEQNCCGMPSMLEGDRQLTLKFADRTISVLDELVADGYDVVCSCPTCGYMLKTVCCEGAYYSDDYQNFVGTDGRHIKIPQPVTDASGKTVPYRLLSKSIYGSLLKDDGYFSGIDPLKRIRVAEHTRDLGEYLLGLHRHGEFDTNLAPVPGQLLYYPPCHQREQGIGNPYLSLLTLIPDLCLDAIENTAYCCGIAGIMGFKRDFHQASIQMGSRLMAEIKRIDPDHLMTDCLSCRLQFNQLSTYPVRHPIEILCTAYQ
jgi:glycerol-3-phosphate dehydrogenase subunit C